MTALSLDAESTPAGWLYANLRLLCRYSSVVEHTLGKGGVVSPILTSGTIFKISAFIADFLFLNNHLFSPILEVLKTAIFAKLSDFRLKNAIL